MKLFQKMLVAGTALSLIAPVASQASETLNLEEMNSYVRSEKKSPRPIKKRMGYGASRANYKQRYKNASI